MKGWEEFVNYISSIMKTMDEKNEKKNNYYDYEKIFFNMYIIYFLITKYKEK